MRAVYLESVKSPFARQGFVFRPPAKQMNHSDIYSQAVVEQDSEYAFDSFCVDSDEVEHEESTHQAPSFTPLAPRAAKMRAKRLQANNAKIEPPNSRRRKRIVYEDTSSDEEETAPPPKKSVKPDNVPIATNKLPAHSSRNPDDGKEGTFLRPANAASLVPATDRAVFLPPSSRITGSNIRPAVVESSYFAKSNTTTTAATNSSGIIKSNTGASSVASTSNTIKSGDTAGRSIIKPNGTVGSNITASSAMKSSSLASNNNTKANDSQSCAKSSPPRTLLVSSRQVATTTQVISSLQVKYRCATHVCSFDVADFVLSSQLGVIRKLHSGKFDVDGRKTQNFGSPLVRPLFFQLFFQFRPCLC